MTRELTPEEAEIRRQAQAAIEPMQQDRVVVVGNTGRLAMAMALAALALPAAALQGVEVTRQFSEPKPITPQEAAFKTSRQQRRARERKARKAQRSHS